MHFMLMSTMSSMNISIGMSWSSSLADNLAYVCVTSEVCMKKKKVGIRRFEVDKKNKV